jgi:hypothetical protein
LKSRQYAILHQEASQHPAAIRRGQPRHQLGQLSGIQQAGVFQPAEEPLSINMQDGHLIRMTPAPIRVVNPIRVSYTERSNGLVARIVP